MHNPAPVLENDTNKLLWSHRSLFFNIQTDHRIPVRRPGLIINNQKKRDFAKLPTAVSVDHRINVKENEKKHKYLDLARE